MSTAAVRRYSVAEYLDFERKSDEKHEYFNGEIFAMAGGTRQHSRISANLIRALGNALVDRPCSVNTADLRIASPTGLCTYPDLSVDCGEPQFLDRSTDTLRNPIVVVEVLSPTTERYDRTTKFEHYQNIPSLQEIVLVAQDRVWIEHYARQQDGGQWLLTTISDPDGVVRFPALDCEIPVRDVYAKVEFTPESQDHDRIVVRPPQT